MRKMMLMFCAILMGTTLTMAQYGSGQRSMNPEDMAKRQTAVLKEKLGLNKAQEKKVYDLNLESGRKMAKMREEMQGGGDRSAMREKFAAMRKAQNAEMKKILNSDQYEKYEKYLEERQERRGSGRR